MAEPQTPAQPNGAPKPGQPEPSVSEQWERAKAKVDAAERAAGITPAPDTPPAPSHREKAEAKVKAGKDGPNEDADDAADGDEAEATEQTKREPEGKVTPQERMQFREKKRKAYEKLDTKEREINAREAQLQAKYSRYEKIEAARDAGDDEAVLQELYGYGLNEFQKRAVDRIRGRDPRVERLERELREEKEARAKAEKAENEQRAAERMEREKHEWVGNLAVELQAHEDPIVSKLAKFGEFLSGLKLPGVFDAQEESFDGDDYASAEEAAAAVIPKYRAVYQALHSVFGEQGASNPDASKEATSRSGQASAKPPAKAGKKAIAQRTAAEASPSNGKGVDDATLIARYSQRIAESTPD